MMLASPRQVATLSLKVALVDDSLTLFFLDPNLMLDVPFPKAFSPHIFYPLAEVTPFNLRVCYYRLTLSVE